MLALGPAVQPLRSRNRGSLKRWMLDDMSTKFRDETTRQYSRCFGKMKNGYRQENFRLAGFVSGIGNQ